MYNKGYICLWKENVEYKRNRYVYKSKEWSQGKDEKKIP